MNAADTANAVQPHLTHNYDLTTMQVDDFEHMSYTTYGIKITDCHGNILLAYPDVSTSRENVSRLIKLLREGDVALVHIGDVLEDFLD